jgi:hypothetical protein
LAAVTIGICWAVCGVFESLGPDNIAGYTKSDNFAYRYPLKPLSAQTIFSRLSRKIERKELEQEYQTLFDLFRKKLAGLHHRHQNVALWAEHFDSLLMTFTSMMKLQENSGHQLHLPLGGQIQDPGRVFRGAAQSDRLAFRWRFSEHAL